MVGERGGCKEGGRDWTGRPCSAFTLPHPSDDCSTDQLGPPDALPVVSRFYVARSRTHPCPHPQNPTPARTLARCLCFFLYFFYIWEHNKRKRKRGLIFYKIHECGCLIFITLLCFLSAWMPARMKHEKSPVWDYKTSFKIQMEENGK